MTAVAPIIYVHEVQRGNPLLKYIRNVKWEFSQDIVPDYVMGTACALFVSVKFHFRHPTVRTHVCLLLLNISFLIIILWYI